MVDIKSLVVFASAIYLVHCTSGKVPALIWSTRTSDFQAPLAGHTLNSGDFHNKYLSPASEDEDIVVFLQDKLSLDDFTQYADVYNENSNGGPFKNVKNLMESMKSVHIASVRSPSASLDQLRSEFSGTVHDLQTPYSLNDLKLQKRNLINVHLPSTKSGLQSALGKIDGAIGSVTSQLKAAGRKFTAVYTGQDNSKIEPNDLYVGRHLLADVSLEAGPQNVTFINVSDCLYFYTKGASFQMLKENGQSADWMATLPALSEAAPGSFCNGTGSSQLTVSYNKPSDNITELTWSMHFILEKRWWKVERMEVSYTVISSDGKSYSQKNMTFDASFLTAPSEFSYKCVKPDGMNQVNTSVANVARLLFGTLQVQPMNIKNSKFSAGDDCVGVFSIPIWMGLVVSLVLILILAFGVVMMMNITTQERFDDPKGKGITVNVDE